MNCIIIEDEVLAAEIIESHLAKFPTMELLGKFNSPILAVPTIMSGAVDLIFLDINMPDINGIQFYENLPVKPAVIFTTAYSDYAVKGFEINAVDYLLKPISFERFFQAISKFLNKVSPLPKPQGQGTNYPSPEVTDYLIVKADYASVKVDLDRIVYMEGYKDYVKIHLQHEPKPLLTLNSMKHYEVSLFAKGFIRIHKRHIVSINKIENISRNRLKMKDKPDFLLIGEAYRDFFFEVVVNNRS